MSALRLSAAMPVEEVNEMTSIDPWFLTQVRDAILLEDETQRQSR